MKSRYLLPIVSLLLILLVGCAADGGERRPNIVWIIAEDLSQDLGAYGNDRVNTPHIDRLAREGMKFTHIFTAAPICTPSRTALGVGMHQGSIDAHHMRYPDRLKLALPQGVQTMNDHLQENGYVTANIHDAPGTGKVDWSFKADLSSQFEYEHWDDLARQNEPFFAQVSISYTHRPFPEVDDTAVDEAIEIPPYYPDHPVARSDFSRYYKSIERLDTEVGNVLSALERRGMRENTIVFFFSDHGRPMPRGKSFHYDSGIRIPAIIHIPSEVEPPPQYQPGATTNQLISAIDFSATSLALAGIEKPSSMHGRVFWGEAAESDREYIYSAVDRTGESHFKSRAIRSRRYKFIRNYRHDFSINQMATAYRRAHHPIYHLLNILNEKNRLTPAQAYLVDDLPAEELYDLEKDPFEINNLANDPNYQDVKNELENRLEAHLEEVGDQGLGSDSEQIVQVFEAYGEQSYQQRKEDIARLHQQVMEEVEK